MTLSGQKARFEITLPQTWKLVGRLNALLYRKSLT